MDNVVILLGAVVSITAIVGGFSKLVYDYATLKATLETQTAQILKEILEIKKYFHTFDKRLDDHESRLTKIETQHAFNHERK